MTKTNAMRLLDQAQIPYKTKEYHVDMEDLSGTHAADLIGVDYGSVYKTLVLKAEKLGYLVCCIPVDQELDLKAVAKAAGVKKAEMIPMKDLLSVTGYVRGGCSPIGMKKRFPIYIEERAKELSEISVSGGIRGLQILLSPKDLADFLQGIFTHLTLL